MHYIVLGLVIVVVTLVLLLAGPGRSSRAQNLSTSEAPVAAQVNDKPIEPATNTVTSPTRLWLEQKLIKLQKTSPKSSDIREGAMCYEPGPPADTVDYICPKDGERTHYTRGNQVFISVEDIAPIRAMLKTINIVYLTLDESELCRKCSPDINDPQLVLVVRIPGAPMHRFRGVNYEDIVLIREFLAGEEVHNGDSDSKTPLKDYIPRIEKLLGISIEKPGK